jgi:hypothetical protein
VVVVKVLGKSKERQMKQVLKRLLIYIALAFGSVFVIGFGARWLSDPTSFREDLGLDRTPEVATSEEDNQADSQPDPQPEPLSEQQPETWSNAVNAATAASEAAQTAQTHADWQNVADKWQEAITLMGSVPEADENYATAQQKATEYRPNLDYARQRVLALLPVLNPGKAEAKEFLGSIGFGFNDSPLNDGTPRLLGEVPSGLSTIELYGPPDKLTKAVIFSIIGVGQTPQQADVIALYNVSFLEFFAPTYDWDSWLGNNIQELASNGSGRRTSDAGDKTVELSMETITEGIYSVILTVEPK